MTDFFFWLGDMFQVSFRFLEFFNRNANVSFIIIGFIAFFIWLWLQHRYNKEASERGSFK
jgi:hypothetical protein